MITMKSIEGVIALAEAVTLIAKGGPEFQNILTTLKQEVDERDKILNSVQQETENLNATLAFIKEREEVQARTKEVLDTSPERNAQIAKQLVADKATLATATTQLKSKEDVVDIAADNLAKSEKQFINDRRRDIAMIEARDAKVTEREKAVTEREFEVEDRMAKLMAALK